jgi:hypothetical protein
MEAAQREGEIQGINAVCENFWPNFGLWCVLCDRMLRAVCLEM